MNEEPFFAWWNGDDMSSRNPYDKGTRLYWAWEGWLAGMDLKEYTEDHVRLLIKEAVEAERDACAALCDKIADDDGFEGGYADYCAQAIRKRGQHD